MSTEVESVQPKITIEKCSAIVVDVAGTTTSINFVKEKLFPFVSDNIEDFLKENWSNEAVKEAVKKIQGSEKETELDVSGAVELIKSLTEKQSDNEGLKTIQGLVYKKGYDEGKLKGHVFEEVAEVFQTWAKSRKIAVFSTGSTESQKLLFSHSENGDLSSHISKYFDQSVGSKTEPESYKKISEELETEPADIVFITDLLNEAKAAQTAGCKSIVIKRENNEPLDEESSKDFTIVTSFKEINFESNSKRKSEEEEETTSEAPPSKIAKTEEESKSTEEAQDTQNNKEEEKMEVDKIEKEEKVETEESTKTETETDSTKQNETDEKMDVTEKTAGPEKPTEEVAKVEEKNEVDAKVKEITEEEKVEEKSKQEEKTETVEEKTENVEEEKIVENKESVDKVDEPIVDVVEDKVEENKKDELDSKKEEKTADDKPEEVKEKKTEESTEKDSEVAVEKSDIVVKKTEDTPDKTEEISQKTEEGEKTAEANGTGGEEAEQVDESDKPAKVEEKENKSVLANGVENGDKVEGDEVEKASTETNETEVKKTNEETDNKIEETEVKVKALDENAEAKTVSVEV